jgi:hypothetical protein
MQPESLGRRLVLVGLLSLSCPVVVERLLLGLPDEQRELQTLRRRHAPSRSAVCSILDISGKACQQIS